MIKKIILSLLLIVIAIIAVFFIWRYLDYSRNKNPYKTFLLPRLELSEVVITSLTSEKTEMMVKVIIENHIPFSFTADSLQYKVFINDTEVMKDHYIRTIKLKGNDTSSISLPITIFNQALTSVLNSNKQKGIDSVEYKFQVSFFTHIILFKKRFDVEVKRFLPLVYIPEVKAEHIKISSLKFSGAEVELLVSITNRNAFSLKAKDIAYQLSIEDNQWIKGIIPGLTDIRAKSVSEITIPMKISFKEIGKTIFDLLTKGDSVRYKIHMTFRMESGNNMVKNSKVILYGAGTVKSLMKAVK